MQPSRTDNIGKSVTGSFYIITPSAADALQIRNTKQTMQAERHSGNEPK